MRRSEFADYPFDKDKFSNVLKRARGERNQKEFCRDSGLSYAYMNRYANGKTSDAPTIQTLKKIAFATKTVTYEELLSAAGYDPEKYKHDKPRGSARKDFLYPIFLGIANSEYDWKIEKSGYEDGKPFEILIENDEVSRWYFIPVMKERIEEADITADLFQTLGIPANSKVSFITDDEQVFNDIKTLEFPLLSLYLSVIKVYGSVIEEEVEIKTAVDTDITASNEDRKRPYCLL